MEKEADFFTDMLSLSLITSPNGSSSKMYQACLIATEGKISEFFSKSWMNSGMAFRGEYLMQNISEHPNAVVESTLSAVLEASAPLKYFLSPNHLQSLLDRAELRQKPLPENLQKTLQTQINLFSNMQASGASPQLALKQKAGATTAKATPSTVEAVPMLSVRRLMPSECETLQGFPKGWTEIDTAP
ncbi:hypothetical protein JCM14076_04640 [Methylosoma difficile]